MRKDFKEARGFIAPVITEDNYVLGAGMVPKVVIKPDGDWTNIPDKEDQNKKFETYNCTSFNTLNRIEQLEYLLTGKWPNYSDRFVGIIAGTKPPGNDPHTVAEAIRKYGLVPEEMLPFSDDLENVDEYYSFKGGDEVACYKAGQEWLKKWEFMHEYVFTHTTPKEEIPKRILESLKYSPLGISVTAWEMADLIYIDGGLPNNHWTGLVKGVPNVKWIANDSYDPYLKDLDWNYKFSFCKRYFLKIRTTPASKKYWFTDIVINVVKFLKDVLITPFA